MALLVTLAVALGLVPAWAVAGGHDDDDARKLVLGIPTLAPNPVQPPRDSATTLTIPVLIRPTDGLEAIAKAPDKDKDRDEDKDKKDEHAFSLELIWTISSGSTAVVSIRKTVDLSPPFTFVKSSSGEGDSKKRYIALSVSVPWDLLTSTGQCARDGTYSSGVAATLIRVHTEHRRRQTKIVARATTSAPDLTLHGFAPVITITSPPVDPFITNKATVPLSGTLTGEGALSLLIDGQPATLTSGAFNQSLTFTRDGPYVVNFVASDCAMRTATASRSIFVDTVSPRVSLVQPSSGAYLNSSPGSIVLGISDPAPSSGIATATAAAQIDGQPLSLVFASSTSATFKVSGSLADGNHRVTGSVSDNAGNVGVLPTAGGAFFLDTVPPVVEIRAPVAGSAIATSTPLLSATFFDPAPASGVVTGSFQALVDGMDTSSSWTVAADQATWQLTAGTALPDGSHSIQISISDRSGNRGTSGTITFITDTRPPVVTIVAPAAGATLPPGSTLLQVAFADPVPGSGISASSFRASVDQTDLSTAFTVTSTGATLLVTSGPAALTGAHTFSAQVADIAGLVGSATVAYTVAPAFTGPQGTISGQVNMGDPCHALPLVGVTVSLLHAFGQTVTDAAGRFSLQAPVGLAWLDFAAAGYLPVQRSVRVVENQPVSMPVVFLVAQDTKVTHVIASQGGIVTDSTGKASLQLYPGALLADTDIALTLINDPNASEGPPLRNFIPGVGVRITPAGLQLKYPALLQVSNTLHMPVHPIFGFDWDRANQQWLATGDTFITPDDQFFDAYVSHFSGVNCTCGPVSNVHCDSGCSPPPPPPPPPPHHTDGCQVACPPSSPT